MASATRLITSGKALTPERRREAALHLVQQGSLSIAKAYHLTRLSRRSWYRPDPNQHRLERDQPVIDALNAIVQDPTRSRWGFWTCFYRLRLDGKPWNFKRSRFVILNHASRTKMRILSDLIAP